MKINIGKVILIILYSIAIGLGIFASSISDGRFRELPQTFRGGKA